MKIFTCLELQGGNQEVLHNFNQQGSSFNITDCFLSSIMPSKRPTARCAGLLNKETTSAENYVQMLWCHNI